MSPNAPRTFILIASDVVDILGNELTGVGAALQRMKGKIWPLYQGTKNCKTIRVGDRCVFYVAGVGAGAQSFLGEAKVAGYLGLNDLKALLPILAAEQYPASVLLFDEVELYQSEKSIRPILTKLSFIPENKTKWGSAFQGGCRLISPEDYKHIRDA